MNIQAVTSDSQSTALHYAVCAANPAFVILLTRLYGKELIARKTRDGYNAIHIAVLQLLRDEETIPIKRKRRISSRNEKKDVETRDKRKAKILNKKKTKKQKKKPRTSESSVSATVFNEKVIKCAEVLLASGIGVMEKDNKGMTPLHHAAVIGNTQFLLLLLQYNPSVNLNEVDNNGDTALHLAIRSHSIRFIHVLMEQRNLQCSIANNEGMTPLLLSVAEGEKSIMKVLLVTRSINLLDKKDMQQRNSLHLASMNNHTSCLKYLLDIVGEQIFECDARGNTPFNYCARNCNLIAMKLLLDKCKEIAIDSVDSFINHRGMNQQTPLHNVVSCNGVENGSSLLSWSSTS